MKFEIDIPDDLYTVLLKHTKRYNHKKELTAEDINRELIYGLISHIEFWDVWEKDENKDGTELSEEEIEILDKYSEWE